MPGFQRRNFKPVFGRFVKAANAFEVSMAPRVASENMPVVIVAYSGGYLATAWSLSGRSPEPLRVVLLDALWRGR